MSEKQKLDTIWDSINPTEPLEELELDADVFDEVMNLLIPSQDEPYGQENSET